MYSKEQIRFIVHGVDLVTLIGQRVHLKKTGKSYLGLCPFHQEKTPSFHVDPVKKFYHCFGCKKHGDALQFLVDDGNSTFLEAIEQLAVMQGVALKANKKNFHPSRKILEVAQNFFLEKARNLPVEVRAYLESRKFHSDSIKKFEIGYAPNAWDGLKNSLPQDSFLDAQKVGLLRKSDKNKNHYYDFFRHRIMFPFRDYQGALIGFAGRSVKAEDQPKYLNSPEIELFQKNSFFYGLYQAKQAIQKKKRVIVVEGYTDVMRMSEKGVEEVIAVAGTAITEKHIYALKQKMTEVIFLFDADSAGNKAAMRATRMSLGYGLDAKIAILPANSDPDSFLLTHSLDAMRELLTRAEDVLQYILNQQKNLYQASGLSQKNKILNDLLEFGSSIAEASKQSIFLSEVAKNFEIDVRVLQQKFYPAVESEKQKINFNRVENTETKLLKAVLQNLETFPLLRQYLQPQDFSNQLIQRLLQRLFSMQDQEIMTSSISEFLQIFCDDQKIVSLLLYCSKHEDIKQPQGKLEQWIYDIKKKSIYQNYASSIYAHCSRAKQKELWQAYKAKLKKIEHLTSNTEYKRVASFTNYKQNI